VSWFEFAGASTEDIPGLSIEKKSIYGFPQRDVEKIVVPGRNGEILIDNGSYRNINVSYQCAITDYMVLYDISRMLTVGNQAGSAFQPWRGYQPLCDSYNSYERLAVHSSKVSMEELISGRFLRFNLVFDCKPQKFFSRSAVIALDAPGNLTVNRPIGAVSAAPRIEIVGSGTVELVLDGQALAIHGLILPPMTGGEYRWPSVVIDSEAMLACTYDAAGVRANLDIVQWPRFWKPASNVSASGNIARLKIYPRWWSI